MDALFGPKQSAPQYIPPPPPAPAPPTFADAAKAPGSNPSTSLIGTMGGTNTTGAGLQTEASTTRKSLLGD